ncbi:MAG: cell division protein ZapE [Rhodospirillaceae bacterium]|nr:cell division protein ZapE [Rhodospirillaceae bacterium]
MTDGPLSAYRALRDADEIQEDPLQAAAAETLQRLHDALKGYRPEAVSTGWKARLGFGGKPKPAPRGLYIFGPAGRGKSMLMDLFFDSADVDSKRRVHFHEFMIEVHDTIHAWRQSPDKLMDEVDPLPRIAREIAGKSALLCFDEFHVTNIADAMMLGRLFEGFFDAGVVIVATSNFAADDLYMNGLQRDRFLPFIDLIKERLNILELSSPTDYRQARLSRMQVYHMPLDDGSDHALDLAFRDLTEGARIEEEALSVKRREIDVVRTARGVAYFDFEELCQRPLGAEDYIAIGDRFHTIILAGIPRMSKEMRNEAKRFMNLIDVLYEKKVNLVASAEAPPEELYASGTHAFEFQRTTSRLVEMQTPEYIDLPHIGTNG